MKRVLLTVIATGVRGPSTGCRLEDPELPHDSPRVSYTAGEELEHEHDQSENKVECGFHAIPPSPFRLQIYRTVIT